MHTLFHLTNLTCGLFGLFGLAVTLAGSAHAGRYSETVVSTSAEGLRQVNISYHDLDLSSKAGQETLRWRIDRAAKLVCGPTDYRGAGSLAQVRDNRECRRNALAQAHSQANIGTVATASR